MRKSIIKRLLSIITVVFTVMITVACSSQTEITTNEPEETEEAIVETCPTISFWDSFTFDDFEVDDISEVSIVYGNNLELTFKEDNYVDLFEGLAETTYTKTTKRIKVPEIILSAYNFGQVNLIIEFNDGTEVLFVPQRGLTKANELPEVTITEVIVTTTCTYEGYADEQSARYISDSDSIITEIVELLSSELPYLNNFNPNERFYVDPINFENDAFTIRKTDEYDNQVLETTYIISDDGYYNSPNDVLENAFGLTPNQELINDGEVHTLILTDQYLNEYSIDY